MRSVSGYLDFLNEFPLEEEIRFFERKSKKILLVVTTKGEYEYTSPNMEKLIRDLTYETGYTVF